MNSYRRIRPTTVRHGLSLMEVILSIAILGGCIAVIGELIRIGSRQAEEARELTVAQLLCESKMNEIAAGISPPEAVGLTPFETDDSWMYSITVTPLDGAQLIEVNVTAQQADSSRLVPLTFSLVRWMIDPGLDAVDDPLGTTSLPATSASQPSVTVP